MIKNPYGDRPAWYVGIATKHIGDYFGSMSSISLGETYVTMDRKYIVYRDPVSGTFSVSRNSCAHAGAQLLERSGVQDHKIITCPIHKWSYDPSGALRTAPFFDDCKHVRLHTPNFGVWNGYVLGNSEEALRVGMNGFGESLGIPASTINPSGFIFDEEYGVELPYPRELMMVNYYDGYHVPLYHQQTFAAVADERTYKWEFSVSPEEHSVGYSVQVVRARPKSEVSARLEMFKKRDIPEEMVGWASFHLWLREKIEKHSIQTPLDPDIFAVWASIYGRGFLMPELYEGGLFLAVSYLVNVDPKNLDTGNKNFVEYYVHRSVPEEIRNEALRRFKSAYHQSAQEDDEICSKLWSAHQLGDTDFRRVYHQSFEAGDHHWRQWFLKQFEVKA